MTFGAFSAVPKTKEPGGAQKTGPVGDPVPSGGVLTRALSGTYHAGKSEREMLVGVASYGATGPGCVWYSFLVAIGGRAGYTFGGPV